MTKAFKHVTRPTNWPTVFQFTIETIILSPVVIESIGRLLSLNLKPAIPSIIIEEWMILVTVTAITL